MIRLEGIHKYFPSSGIEALGGADFELRPGEIHALLGENGAGKSTLMHILAGYMQPSSGTIYIDGSPIRFSYPARALHAGIGMVRQHPRFVPGFKVWEECILGAEPQHYGMVDRKKARERVHELSQRWGFGLDPDQETGNLSVAQRQISAVLSLLLRSVRHIILDEPTAALNSLETEGLFMLLSRLREDGHGIVLISHKLGETLRIADRISVLRRGKTAGVIAASSCDVEKLSRLMFGTKASIQIPQAWGDEDPVSVVPEKEIVLAIQDLSVQVPDRPRIRSVTLELYSGEILGIVGVRDSGLETLELAVTGHLGVRTGDVYVLGQRVSRMGPLAFRKAGGVHVGVDRMGKGLAPRLSLWDNLIVHAHRRGQRKGILDRPVLKSLVDRIMANARVAGKYSAKADSFSGGQLQRLVLAREFAEYPRLMVLAEPGLGLDRNSRTAMEESLFRFCKSGGGVLVFSSDTDDLLSLCSRILVLRDGRIAGTFILTGVSQDQRGLRDRINMAMIGSEACEDTR